jgi:2,4-dienoyl-CoA reductase-like NADH-dependent reductase (Old Yellow Enzyme family)
MAGRVFTEFKLGGLTLRNRVVRSAAFEGMSPGGRPSDGLVEYHGRVAAGGTALTTVAYASVSPDGLTYPHQISMAAEGVLPGLRRLTDAVHAGGAAASIQLGHAGYFADRSVTGVRPMGASRVFNAYGLSLPRPMTEGDIDTVVDDFGRAARLSLEAGFDAVEIQAGHGYLLSQFISPYTNRRTDRWGGSLENRLRFTAHVIRRVRQVVGPEFPILVKTNMRDGFPGGLGLDEAIEAARRFESEGVDALVLSGGFVSRVPMYIMRGEVPFKEMYEGQTRWIKKTGLLLVGRVMIKQFPFEEGYFLGDARKVREAVSVPIAYVGGLRTLAGMEAVLDEGFDLLAMARPLIMEPDLIERMRRGEASESRCEPCNKCIAAMDKGRVTCPLAENAI